MRLLPQEWFARFLVESAAAGMTYLGMVNEGKPFKNFHVGVRVGDIHLLCMALGGANKTPRHFHMSTHMWTCC